MIHSYADAKAGSHSWLSGTAWQAIAAFLLLLTVQQPASAHFVDDFNRTDGTTIGNGWVEKNTAAFALAGGQVIKQAVATGYRDNLVYRPATEDVLDVEASLEFTLLSNPPGYPQVLVRVQSATAATPNLLDGYMIYLPDSGTTAVVGRQNGSAFVTTLAQFNLTSAINTADRYRMRLRATGTNPVNLDAFVERFVANGVWETIGQAQAADGSAARIATAGSVGFSGFIENSYRYDNFARVDLAAVGTPNPLPFASSLSPASANAGEAGLIVVVYGSGFTTDSSARWNAQNRATTYVSPSELEVTLTAADLATAGTGAITIANPAPGGGVSQGLAFQVLNGPVPPPTIASLSPATTVAGAPGFTLTVTGSGYTAGSVVRWGGAALPTTFVSPTQLTAAVAAANVASPGVLDITVLRTSDGVASAASVFTVSAPPNPGDFFDTFTRANNAAIGNGWIEKTAAAFSLAGNEAAKVGAGGNDYRNNIVYRPSSEDLLDVEASVELRFLSLPAGYPQVFVRAQSATVANNAQLDAYLLYINNSATQATLARQRGNGFDTPLVNFALGTPLNLVDRFRLRLRAEGTSPVQLAAFVERLAGTTWQVIGQATFSDAATARIATAGSVGFGGYVETNYRYDNFSRLALSTAGVNPIPAATSLAPNSATAGSAGVAMTVNGANFVPGSVVRWNGMDRVTTFVSASQLVAQVTAADLAAAGVAAVSVFNPAPGGGLSGDLTFTIGTPPSNPPPVLGNLQPAAAPAGSPAFTLRVIGSGFVTGSVVRWNGNSRTTTYLSGTELQANITAGDVAAVGTAEVRVFTPAPGGGLSASLAFQVTAVNNPVPTTTGLSPSSVVVGSPSLQLTVFGTNFLTGSVVRWNGADRATTFISPTELQASVPASDLTTTGNRTITVFNPAPGGGTSNGQSFSVVSGGSGNPVPVISQLSPLAQPPGGSAFTLTVTGSGFATASVVRWNGQARPTTFVSSAELRASIAGSNIAAAGLATITVDTPAPGGGTTSPLTFFVQDGSTAFFFDGFNRPNNAAIGNGWNEKNPDAFSIQNGEVVSIVTPYGFTQDIMYRPAAEARLNLEASTEFRRLAVGTTLGTANFPQVHARVQTGNITQFNTLDSYIFFIDDLAPTPSAMFAVTTAPQPGVRWECYIRDLPLPGPLVEGARYRLRFQVSGVSPVVLNGWVDRFQGGSWTTIASGSATHSLSTQRDPNLYCDQSSMPAPIITAGTVGVAKWTNRTDAYDNVYWREIDGPAPPPSIAALSPTAIAAGSAGFQLTVTGDGFGTDSVVRWNGANRATTFVSATELRASVTSADVASAGTASVAVLRTSTGATSTPVGFEVTPAGNTVTLFDDFNRADAAAVGNGWIEKNPNAFALQGGAAVKLSSPGADYRNNIVYRAATEDALNTEASFEFRALSLPVGYPSVLTRVQANTVGTPLRFDGYMLYISNSATQATLARQSGAGWDVALATLNLAQPLNVTDTYRLRISAFGTNPVQLRGYVERWTGSMWQILAQASVSDTSPQRIATAGSVAFGGYIEDSYRFDNFRRVDLGP